MRSHGLWPAAVAALIFCFLSDAAFAQQKRVALVIGNSDYSNYAPVSTAVKDASDIGDVLNLAGFTVIRGTNLNREAVKDAIARLNEAAKDADLAVIYFGGQGMQIGAANFLLPVDASNASRQAAMDSAIAFNDLMKNAPGKPAFVVYLDAARNDPFVRLGESRDISIDDVSHPRFLHVVYSTGPNSALAPFDGPNGAFATALLKHINNPSLPLRLLDRAVRVETVNLTKGRQVPWSSTTGNDEDIVFFAHTR